MAVKSDILNHQGIRIIDLTPDTIADYGVCGYKDIGKHLELRRKVDWFAQYYPLGLRIKALITQEGGYQGMMEYIPGEYAHRPVHARDYMFIHCIFVGFKKEFKGKGYASIMIEECIRESKQAGLKGVAVVTRKGSFMADNAIFLKKGFEIVDRRKPDFDLLALKFDESTESPSFMKISTDKYSKGLFILRSPQCPYSVKNVEAIIKTAISMKLDPVLVELDSHETAQQSPCPFGTFCIIHDGVVLSHHPISNTRFETIIKSKK